MTEVERFERAFAEYVGARYAIAMCNGTATLHTALAVFGVRPDEGVAVPPLTMASTAIAVLHAGGVPKFVDVYPETWLMKPVDDVPCRIPVSLYGLHYPTSGYEFAVDDAAQTLRPHSGCAFTSYSFQASKILALGEGGMLVTDEEELASSARRFASLGYPLAAKSSSIIAATLKHPRCARHLTLGYNYRMADVTAESGLHRLEGEVAAWRIGGVFHELDPHLTAWESIIALRRFLASFYSGAIGGCSWIRPQYIPKGSQHDYWTFAVALESAELFEPFTNAVVKHGGERPYGAWRVTYQEPAFRHLAEDGTCPIAEELQPRLVQFQTNDTGSARTNADAVAKAIAEVDG